MKQYTTLTDALDDLRQRGFSADFNLKQNSIACSALELELRPDEFAIVEVHRFEGATNPDDSSVLYAIEGKGGLKGVLVDAYGMYADPVSTDLLAKLQIRHDTI